MYSLSCATSDSLNPSLTCHGTLVVEDSPMHKANLCNWLKTFGLDNVITSGDGQHALELVRNLQKPPCLMILDLELPGMDGIELLQNLYELHIKPSVIVLSSADDGLLGAVATMVDAMGFTLLGALSKPLTPSIFTLRWKNTRTSIAHPRHRATPQSRNPNNCVRHWKAARSCRSISRKWTCSWVALPGWRHWRVGPQQKGRALRQRILFLWPNAAA